MVIFLENVSALNSTDLLNGTSLPITGQLLILFIVSSSFYPAY